MNFRYLTITKSPDAELLEVLNNNIIGTPGQGMLYQHLQVNQKINLIQDPYFVNLVRAEKIVGTCCFCCRETLNSGKKIKSFYVRYFSFRDAFRRKSIPEKTGSRRSALRREVETLLTGQGLEVSQGEKFFHYAYVDPRNKRSAVLCEEFGFERVREYTTVMFSRLNPKADSSLRIIETPAESVMELLKTHYEDFNMLSFENLRYKKYYFIENDNGQRVAGVLVNPDQWKIHSLPGFFMNVLLKIFTRIPVLNKLLNENFRFLTFEGVYVLPGHEKYLEKLFESLLARYKVNTAICIVDAESKIYSSLKSLRLGLMSRLNKEVKGYVICRFQNFTEEERSIFKSHPAFISGIDAT